jgi:bifunctional UDP-N-acetylglucosamine pyrophosphorylase/glucosamine-1-phosphate N-acetyltransferase
MNIVILAAGTGKRMQSTLPKVLHPLGGRPLLAHFIDTARALEPTRLVVVIGHGAEAVREAVAAPDVQFAVQEQQLGTGHAVQQALPLLDPSAPTLVLYGDVPLTRASTLQALIDCAGRGGYGVLTVTLDDPSGYGRIVRDRHGKVARIVEQKDATPEQLGLVLKGAGIRQACQPDRHRATAWGSPKRKIVANPPRLAMRAIVPLASRQLGCESRD